MFDVVVIGGGMAGCVAALAAKQAGASVALASRSWGVTALSTGALDIAFAPALARADQSPRTLIEHLMDIAAHRHRHPYAVVGVERSVTGLRQGFELLRSALRDTGLAPPELNLEAENLALPSASGVAMPCGTALGPHLGLNLATKVTGRWGVLGLHGDAHFQPKAVIRGLRADGRALAGHTPDLVPVDLGFDGGRPPFATARMLDDHACLENLMRDLVPKVRGLAGLIAPPVLGLDRHASVRERLSNETGLPIVEALSHLPSVPGVRLQRALDAELDRQAIPRLGEIVAPRTDGRTVRAVVTSDGLEVDAGSFVLATGRFVTGGVAWGDRCVESLFGLALVTKSGVLEEDSPHRVVRDTPMESHPLLTAGVQVQPDLRPIVEGRVAYENLFAAGMVIGGFAARYTLCTDGVALATGWWAGQAATGVSEATP